jgi:tetratricopeptide (TPR) repeat protein
MSPTTTTPAIAAAPPRVEVNYRWLLLLASVVPVLVLRGHRTGLLIYSGVLSFALLTLVVWLPRRVADAERRFTRDALRRLSMGDHTGLEALAARQWLLRTFGRKHVIPETLGLSAAAAGDHELARQRYAVALSVAPTDERLRIEVNLAGEELATERWTEAEGRYRMVLRRRPDLSIALANLGRILVRRADEGAEARETLNEAVDVLERALPLADSREQTALRLLLAEALIRVRAPQARWQTVLERAVSEGADAAAVSRLEGLARP